MTTRPYPLYRLERLSLLAVAATVALLWLLLAASFDPLATTYLPGTLVEVLS